MAFYKNLTHQHLEMSIDVGSLQILIFPGMFGSRVKDLRVDVVHHLNI
jgi:hypothetical protein